jgi:hypothetical protein
VVEWISNGFALHEPATISIYGLLLIVLGFQTFCFTLLLQILSVPPTARSAGR